MQSKRDSASEALQNTALGFLISLIVWKIVGTHYGIYHGAESNLIIVTLFTITSFARSYLVRRFWATGITARKNQLMWSIVAALILFCWWWI